MTDQQHPITPPPELFKQWEDNILNERDNVDHVLDCAWRNGFQAGADQELEACCQWLADDHTPVLAQRLRAARRPKPTSLKEQALKILEEEPEADYMKELIVFDTAQVEIIRRALEQLDD